MRKPIVRGFAGSRYIRRVAEDALAQYAIKAGQITQITNRHNVVFRVSTEYLPQPHTSETSGQQYVLRISARGERTKSLLCSEIIWLRHLRENTDLLAPVAIATTKGEFVATVVSDDMGTLPFHSVLFEWRPGRFMRTEPPPSVAGLAGRYLAQLHSASNTFFAPTDFVRPYWDFDGIVEIPPGIDISSGWSLFSKTERYFIEQTAAHLKEQLQRITMTPDTFGMIHFDFKPDNYLVHKRVIGAIDFDLCGFGFFFFDIASSLLPFYDCTDSAKIIDAFLSGYANERTLPIEYIEQIRLFTAVKLVARTLWAAGRAASGLSTRYSYASVAERVRVLQQYIKQNGSDI